MSLCLIFWKAGNLKYGNSNALLYDFAPPVRGILSCTIGKATEVMGARAP